eukprot:642961-Prymnesium_polylepis.1
MLLRYVRQEDEALARTTPRMPPLLGKPPPIYLSDKQREDEARAEEDAAARAASSGQKTYGRSACLQTSTLQAAVVEAKGFQWVVEHSKTGLPRPGYVSNTVGDFITFSLGPRVLTASVVYMQSYKGVGRANITCSGPCDCPRPEAGPQYIDSLRPTQHVSIPGIHDIVAECDRREHNKRPCRLLPEDGNCLLTVTNVGASLINEGLASAKGTKFKVQAMIVDRARRFDW